MNADLSDYIQRCVGTNSDLQIAVDIAGKIVHTSSTAKDLFGFELDTTANSGWVDTFILKPANEQDKGESCSHHGNGVEPKRFVNSIRNLHGEDRLISWKNFILRNADGDPIGHFASGEDITNRTHQCSVNQYYAICESSSQGIIALDIEHRHVRFANPAVCEFFGYTVDETLELSITDMHPKDNKEQIAREFELQVNGKQTPSRSIPCLHKDGTVLYADIKSSPIELDGRLCLVGFFTDVTERLHSENALIASENKYRLLVESSPHGIREVDTTGTITFANPAQCELHGFTQEEMIGIKIWDLGTADPLILQKKLKAVLRDLPDPTPYVFDAYTKGGQHKTLRVDWAYKFNGDKQVIGFVSLVTNITDENNARLALSQNESQLRAIMNSLRETSIVVYTAEGLVTAMWFDPALSTRYGHNAQEFIGKHISDVLPPIQAEHRLKNIRQVISTGETIQSEIFSSLPGGEYWFDSTLSPLTDENGIVTAAVGFFRDISQQKKADQSLAELNRSLEHKVASRTKTLSIAVEKLRFENALRVNTEEDLRVSEEKFRSLVENSSDWIWEKDISLNHVYSNNRVFDILGYTADEICEMNFSLLYHPDESVDNLELFQGLVHSRVGWTNWTRRICHKDRSYRVLESTAKPILDDHGNLIGYRGVDRDITHRSLAETQLQDHKAKLAHVTKLSTMGATVSGLAHELNQPLSALAIYADTCVRMADPEMSQTLTDTLEKIAVQAERAGKIIRRVQQFARKGMPHLSSYDINELIHESVSFIESEAKLSGVRISLVLSDSIPMILGDPIQIQQVILNLVRNAFDSMNQGVFNQHILTIKSFLNPDKQVIISVEDTGSGFEIERSEDIFESFFTTKQEGMGLGLSISRSIVETHGGHLYASLNPERGSTFVIEIPLSLGEIHVCS